MCDEAKDWVDKREEPREGEDFGEIEERREERSDDLLFLL